MSSYNFFDEDFEKAEFRRAIDRFGTWPMTVWEYDHQSPQTVDAKRYIGDLGESRHGSFMSGGGVYGGRVKSTIFNPQYAAWAIRMFCPEDAVVVDPFAGGGTRAIVAAALNRHYLGVELRSEEVEMSNKRIRASGFSDLATIVQGDANRLPFAEESCDFLITCPPYYDLEKYNGGPKDLSMASSYRTFLSMLRISLLNAWRVLKPGALSVWFVGLHRDRSGVLLPIHHDLVRLAKPHFDFVDEVVLYHKNTGAIQRVGNFDKGRRRLIRTHEYAVVMER